MKIRNRIVVVLLIVFVIGCKKKVKKTIKSESTKEKVETKKEENNLKSIDYTRDKAWLKPYYELDHIKESYNMEGMEFVKPPELDYQQDITKLAYDELRLLRNEIFARNGYLFKDGFLRGYFNRYKWYMPIFDVDTFKIKFNEKEKGLIAKILKEEKSRKEDKYITKEDLRLLNADLIVNKRQFTEIPAKIIEDFKKQNFSIIAANRTMPFFTYDENAYQFIPHYITTDLYLFILHKYFSKSLEKLDANYMYKTLLEIIKETSNKLKKIPQNGNQEVLDWTKMYSALALYAIGENTDDIPVKYESIFKEEKLRIDNLNGKPLFISNPFVNYKELKPRGHYTKSEKLKKYFRAFKWISLNGINLDKDEEFKGMLLFAHTIKKNPKIYDKYKEYSSIIEKLAGQEDNISLSDIIKIIDSSTINELLANENVALVKNKLKELNKEKIKLVLGENFKTKERDTKRVYFLSSTYSISGEIFSKLVHVDREKSKRPFPRGLDLPAVFKNKTAIDIILNEYKDNVKWGKYTGKLIELQNQFKGFNQWNHNYGFRGLKTALDASAEQEKYPDYMKTNAYNRKELSTTLASWTHVKHDLILYQEKPSAAEGGQGGGPQPPQHFSYVEPNLKFWDSALELVNWLEKLTLKEATFEDELVSIKKLGKQLRNVAYKQIEGREITEEEYEDLHFVGGTIEYILLGLFESDHIPERDRSMALIADVYAYNGTNLNVAVGHADDIYTVVPFKNEYYIARGAVFSYYEFKGEIYDDDEWKEKIKKNELPKRPKWIQPIINNVPNLEGQMQYRYEGAGYYN